MKRESTAMQLTAQQQVLLEKIKQYVSENYQEYEYSGGKFSLAVSASYIDDFDELVTLSDLKAAKTQKKEPGKKIPIKLTFTEKLMQLMNEKGLSAPEVYKYANLDKTLFSKMLSDSKYSPSKDTAIATCFGLRLNLKEAKDLLDRAGYTLAHSIERDVALECCFKEGVTNVVDINILLSELGHKPLGRKN